MEPNWKFTESNFDFEVVFMSIIRQVSVHKLLFDIVYDTCKQ